MLRKTLLLLMLVAVVVTWSCAKQDAVDQATDPAEEAFAAVRTAGTVVFNGEQGPLPLSPSEHFIRRDVTAIGSWFYHFGEIPAMIDAYRGGLPVLDLVTHRFPYTQAEEAYALFVSRVTGKVLLDWRT